VLTFLLRLFAVIVFFMLATALVIHTKQAQWAYGASAAFVASFLTEGYGPVGPSYGRRQPTA
jgi:hypothetical protein